MVGEPLGKGLTGKTLRRYKGEWDETKGGTIDGNVSINEKLKSGSECAFGVLLSLNQNMCRSKGLGKNRTPSLSCKRVTHLIYITVDRGTDCVSSTCSFRTRQG